ncbi:MAG: hypothetical protein DDT34_02457 [Firmicutes bacterium]|nr:hypothetical protein [Bacillota bacterium]
MDYAINFDSIHLRPSRTAPVISVDRYQSAIRQFLGNFGSYGFADSLGGYYLGSNFGDGSQGGQKPYIEKVNEDSQKNCPYNQHYAQNSDASVTFQRTPPLLTENYALHNICSSRTICVAHVLERYC